MTPLDIQAITRHLKPPVTYHWHPYGDGKSGSFLNISDNRGNYYSQVVLGSEFPQRDVDQLERAFQDL